MWIKACSAIVEAVHPVMAQVPALRARSRINLGPVGSAFCINDRADFLTAAHVLHDDLGDVRRQPTLIHHPIDQDAEIVSADIIAVSRDLDIAVLRASPKQRLPSVAFAGRDPIPMGSPAGSIGYPIPRADPGEDESEFKLTRRFVSGFISGANAEFVLWKKGVETIVYEVNMLSYHGNSGGPLFDERGHVIGLAQGTLLHQGNVAAFALAVRNHEIFQFLEGHGIAFNVG